MLAQLLVLLPVAITWPLVGVRALRNGYYQLAVTWLVAVTIVLLFRVHPIWMPWRYYDLYRWESTVYEWIGIRIYKKLVRRGPLHQFNPTLKCEGKKDLFPLRGRFMRVETIHLYALVIMMPVMIYTAAQSWPMALGGLIFINLFINAYPVMLQRYNRKRIENMLAAHQRPLTELGANVESDAVGTTERLRQNDQESDPVRVPE